MGRQINFCSTMRQLVALILPLFMVLVASETKTGKLLPFQIVKFPNDPCIISGGTKNGTCYTAEECSDRGGTSSGSCAEGYGVCCTFTLGCGGSSSENCTYFEVMNSAISGACSASICNVNSNICQLRLDFETFQITGPATVSVSVDKMLGGTTNTAGKEVAITGQCLTDQFTIGNSPGGVGVLCGTLTNDHMYVDASNSDCHSMNLNFGTTAVGVGTVATRNVKIKVLQLGCGDSNLPPKGCTQCFYGTGGTGIIKNFNQAQGQHLSSQNQVICIRREQGNCRVCYSASAVTDIELSGTKLATAGDGQGFIKDTLCCGYGSDGMKESGYDCIMIPGAKLTGGTVKYDSQCGGAAGLVTAMHKNRQVQQRKLFVHHLPPSE